MNTIEAGSAHRCDVHLSQRHPFAPTCLLFTGSFAPAYSASRLQLERIDASTVSFSDAKAYNCLSLRRMC